MVVTSNELRDRFNILWPNLKDIWLRNKQYILPTKKELEDAISLFDYSDMKTIPGFNECENFALFLHSDIKKFRVLQDLPNPQQLNWCFGDFICKKQTTFQGIAIHTANICLCEDDFYIIEPMYDNLITKADINKYDIFFVNMN